ncbi:metal-dependent hydrolase [Jiulongibacter sediminis]|jgi:L-ascorbate metabolism protein UlaG (beta-lactamase superfamily)|uniref:metal-dependent hydrolase n=1 Tax=Jiulongibacter sediminis TaxID=1605367 RepID=UPI0026F0EAA2|nr:metal-dependent hydrolase [Jiulongibacter sediminis]
MEVTYFGHSCFQIETQGKTLLIDPFISANPLASAIDVSYLKPDYILITHGHQDHVLDAETIAKRSGAKIISNFEIVTWYSEKGIDGHGMNHGGKFNFDFGTLKYVTAVHSSVLPDGTNGGNPGGFVLWNSEGCIYLAGDTALTLDMQLIPITCPELDLAILPIGDNFTMGFDDAVLAAGYIGCKNIVGCHYDTFPPIQIDTQKALEVFEKAGIKLTLPKISESLNL